VRRYRITFGHIEIGECARRFIDEALGRNWISEGPNVKLFESRFAQRFGYPHAIAVSSGTDAGLVAMAVLHDLGAHRGDEVITPALAFVATANGILAAGLVPRFVDVELETLNINPEQIEAAITPRTRAIQVVHTMGKPCRMGEILEIARAHKLVVIEDACEAHGATLNGQVVGSFGDAGLFSFYAAHLICSGEGGMIVTHREDVDALCRSVRTHGRRDGDLYFHFDRIGFNSKMNDLEAAIGLEGLERFDANFQIRRGHLAAIRAHLHALEDRLYVYDDGPGEVVCPHAVPIVLRDPSADITALYKYLEEHGIQCKTLFGALPVQHSAFRFLGRRPGDFPIAERIGRTGLHFGVHQYLTQSDIAFIAETLDAFFATST
jgi:dTDP-4-amino-4,6-dideoxygalactose transaminase